MSNYLDSEIDRRPLPGSDDGRTIRPFGVVGPTDLLIFIATATMSALTTAARTNLRSMLGGVLIGVPFETEGRLAVSVDGVIPARRGESRQTSFTFTHAAWTAILQEKEELFPDKPMVGWFLTQPGLGVFMSDANLALHSNFFKMPYQVFLCIDPVRDQLGFFAWNDVQMRTCGFHVTCT
jgi:hypothetical protein